ncbi:MAG TPA: D-glycero-beta-D-manno-heptose 1,7-bisphosphate 7-phosphatase [Anaerolineae bacterium]|nr:D-glycero-beta-D-manno-heptose 1,7-bisphosphate 7-phosphatase [Anaerolineae bacterium]
MSHPFNPKRALFLDRDGVINKNRPDNVKAWDEFEFEAGSLEALARLEATDFSLIVVSNQSGIGRGQMTAATVDAIHTRMLEQIAYAGGRIERVYYCPHTPEAQCTCRKPSPEMLLRGRDELGIELAHSYFVGDWVDDVHAAYNAGVTPLLVLTGRGASALEQIRAAGLPPPPVFKNLAAAVDWILEKERIPAQVGESE